MATKKPRYHHGALSEALVEEARRQIEGGGESAMSLRGCARALGVDPAAVYRHFQDKEALLAAVAASQMRALIEEMRSAMGAEYSAEGRFLALGRAYVSFGLTRPELYRFLFGGQCPVAGGDGDEGSALYGLLTASLDELLSEGVITVAGREGAALLAWAGVHGLVSLWLSGRVPVERAEAEALVGSLCRSLLRGWS